MASYGKLFFHIFVLTGLALSPLYGVLSAEPNFFLAHRSEPMDFIVLTGMISFVFPFVLATVVTLVLYFSGRKQTLAIKIFITFFAALVLLPIVKKFTAGSIPGTVILVVSIGLAFSLAYCKFSGPKLFLNYISPAILFFPVFFFFAPQIFVLVVPEYTQADYPMVSIPKNTPVVFLLFDEFPLSSILNEDLMIDKDAFPNFARLANISHWFRNASTNYGFTGPAIQNILTGVEQDNSRFGTYKYFPKNLFTLLGHDYQVEAHESALRLCPPHICLNHQETEEIKYTKMFWKDVGAVYLNLILPQPKSFGVPVISQSYKNFWDQKVGEGVNSGTQKPIVRKEFLIPMFESEFVQKQVEAREDLFQTFTGKITSKPGKKFYFLHILLPHMPYRFLSSGKKYDLTGSTDIIGFNEEIPKGGIWGKEKWLIKIQHQKLLNQVAYTDYLFGKLLDQLEEKNILDSALFILAADHGASIEEEVFRREVDDNSLADIASVPLFIKLPGQKKGTVSDFPATLEDILPTLADVLDIKIPWKMTGHSLLDLPSGTRERIIHDSEMNAYPVPDDLRENLLIGVKRKQRIFGKFKDWAGFRLRDERSNIFMDKSVTEFSVQAMESVQIKLDLGPRIETKPGFLPAIVQGRVTGIKNKDEWNTLIAVNGVFQAVSPIIKISDQEKILAFLPEKAFKEGGNDVEVYLMRKPFEKGAKIFKPHLIQ